MRIYVIEMSGKGGLLHYSFHLCRALKRVGLDASLVTAKEYELAALPHEFRVVRLFRLWDPRSPVLTTSFARYIRRATRGLRYMLEWLRLVRFLLRERPDVVVFGEMRFSFERHLLGLLRRRGLKLADVVHDVLAYDVSRDSKEIVRQSQRHLSHFRELYSNFSALFIHSRSNCELFLEIYDLPPGRVHRIEHATSELMLEVAQQFTADELRERLHLPSDRPVVTFFGTLTKYKGVEDLIEAFPEVVRKTNAHLLIAGYPAKDIDVAALQSLPTKYQISNSVSLFLDYVPNAWVATLMSLTTVLVLPYRAIAQSGVLQIAYACGVPVVATRVGGLPDAIQAGKSGLLVAPQDPNSLAKAIIEIVGDPEKAAEMASYARQLSQTTFSWRTVAEKMKSVFETLQVPSHRK